MDVRRQVIANKIDRLCNDFSTKCEKEKEALEHRNLAKLVIFLHGACNVPSHRYWVYLSIKLLIKTIQIKKECDKDKTKIQLQLLKLVKRADICVKKTSELVRPIDAVALFQVGFGVAGELGS